MNLKWYAVDVSGSAELEEAYAYADKTEDDYDFYGFVLRLKDGSKTSPYRAYAERYLSAHTFLARAMSKVEKEVGDGEAAWGNPCGLIDFTLSAIANEQMLPFDPTRTK